MDSERPPPEDYDTGADWPDNTPSRYGGPVGDPLAVVRNVAFPIAMRGYAREEVDAFIAEVSEVIAELDATRSPESAVRSALDRVGEETSGILQRAQETADAVTARSRVQADDRVQAAEREARAVRSEAETRVEELDADIEALWSERAKLIEEIRSLADELMSVATAAQRLRPPESLAERGARLGVSDSTTADMAAFEGAGETAGDEPGGTEDEEFGHADDVFVADAGAQPPAGEQPPAEEEQFAGTEFGHEEDDYAAETDPALSDEEGGHYAAEDDPLEPAGEGLGDEAPPVPADEERAGEEDDPTLDFEPPDPERPR